VRAGRSAKSRVRKALSIGLSSLYDLPMQTFEWVIEDIIDAHPDLCLEHFAVMAVALLKEGDSSPCEFFVQVEGFEIADLERGSDFVLRVIWKAETELMAERMAVTEQRRKLVEGGAVAVVALLFAHLVPESQMIGCPYGARADYWLPRLKFALEISGTEHEREIRRRCRQKAQQVLANPRGWDGFVVVCCFARL
jgi:hypothetical protein